MTDQTPGVALQLRSLIKSSGELELSLASIPVPEPGPDEVLVRIEASPINPSDLGLMFDAADLGTVTASGTNDRPVIRASIPSNLVKGLATRVDRSLPVGNEGAGCVVKTGASEAARSLLGKTVAMRAGGMYAQYRCVKAAQCLLLPPGTTPAEGASCFINPLTALGMVETMRLEGHKALAHTAAASNLGQILNRICVKDGIPLVNIVRSEEQERILRSAGAVHVCNSSAPTFLDDLTQALAATGATIAFDAVGGGKLAGQIISAMEAAINRGAKEYSRYGSSTHKQVYVYGRLGRGPIEINRDFGSAWSVSGWLLTPFLQRIGSARAQQLRERVVAELKTTFASKYTKEVSLSEALRLDEIAVYGKRSTGAKYLINPNKRG